MFWIVSIAWWLWIKIKICHIVDSKMKCLNATWLMHTALKSIRIKKAGFKKNNNNKKKAKKKELQTEIKASLVNIRTQTLGKDLFTADVNASSPVKWTSSKPSSKHVLAFFRRAQTQVTTVTIWLLSQMIKHNNCQQSTLHSKGPQTRLSIIKMPTHEDQIYKVNI